MIDQIFQAYKQGEDACIEGVLQAANPYREVMGEAWNNGWLEGQNLRDEWNMLVDGLELVL